jgi:hypothetical protein
LDYLVFASSGSQGSPAAEPPAGYRFETWTPGSLRLRPRGTPFVPFAFWGAFHRLSLFRNRDYGVVLGWQGDALVHYLALVPGYFRFPFVGPEDLQIAVVWTDPDHRGKRIAPFGIDLAMRFRGDGGRRFWYMTAEDNIASARTAERARMELVGRATRRSRVVGAYALRAENAEPG